MIPWIQVYTNVGCHPKTARLAELLELKCGTVQPAVVAVGILVSIWSWAAQNAVDGDLSRVPPVVIADACRWKKSPQKLRDALVEAGYLDGDGKLHDWDEYHVLLMDAEERRREKTKERVRRFRKKNVGEGCPSSGSAEPNHLPPEGGRHECGDATRVLEGGRRCNAEKSVTSVTCNAPTIPDITGQDKDKNGESNDDDHDDFLLSDARVNTELQPGEAVAIRRGDATKRADVGGNADGAERGLHRRDARAREEMPSPFLQGKRGEGGEAKQGTPSQRSCDGERRSNQAGGCWRKAATEQSAVCDDEMRGLFDLPSSARRLNGGHLPPFLCGEIGEGVDGVDEAVRCAIRRHWGRDADERDLARGRREMVYFDADAGRLCAYDAALIDYCFDVSERAGVQAQNWRFVEGVMRKLRRRGITTVEQAVEYEEERG